MNFSMLLHTKKSTVLINLNDEKYKVEKTYESFFPLFLTYIFWLLASFYKFFDQV